MSEHKRPIVLVTDPRIKLLADRIKDALTFVTQGDEAFENCKAKVAGILCIGKDDISARLMDDLPALRIIVTPATGIEGIDLAAARRRGVIVTSGAGVHARDVAQHAIALILAFRHRIVESHRMVLQGDWGTDLPHPRRSISLDRVGILGLGAIGRALAAGLEPLCRDIRWYGPSPKDVRWKREPSLDQLADWSDILVVCARGDDSTRGLIGAGVLDRLGPCGLLVNVARGFMVDESALASALVEGRLGGAALDVYAHEPTDSAFWRIVPNVVLTPHVAGVTEQTYAALERLVVHNLLTLVSGEAPQNVVA